MRTRLAVAIAASLSLVAGSVAERAARPASRARPCPTATSSGRRCRLRLARALGPAGEMRGMALNDVQPAGRGLLAHRAPTSRGWRSTASRRCRSTSTSTSTTRRRPTIHDGLLTPTDLEITTLATAAKASGLTMQLQPVLLDDATSQLARPLRAARRQRVLRQLQRDGPALRRPRHQDRRQPVLRRQRERRDRRLHDPLAEADRPGPAALLRRAELHVDRLHAAEGEVLEASSTSSRSRPTSPWARTRPRPTSGPGLPGPRRTRRTSGA